MQQEQHPSLQKIQQLCEGILPDFEQVSLEDHLAGCEECLSVMSRMDGLLYSGFTAEAHAAALEVEASAADPLAKAIRQAATLYRDLASTLRDWLRDSSSIWGGISVRHLGETGLLPVSGSATAHPIRVTLLPGESRAVIDLREADQILEIECEAHLVGVALLFVTGEETSVHASALQPATDKTVARFEQLPAGSYQLAIWNSTGSK